MYYRPDMGQPWNIHLTDEAKLLIIAAGFGFVAIVFATTVCIVQPACFLHRRIWGRRERERAARLAAAKQMGLPISLVALGAQSDQLSKSQHSLASLEPSESCGATATDSATPQATTPQTPAGSLPSLQRGGPVRDSTYSSMSSGSRGDANTSINEPVADRGSVTANLPGSEEGLSQGHATITVRFMPQPTDPTNERIIGQLGVNVKDAQVLPMRPYGGLCDPYAVVQVIRDVKRMRKRKKPPSKVCEFTTKMKRKTQCPLFNEGFVVPVTKSDIRDGGVLVKVFDAEKHANHSLLGEALVSLKDYDLEHEAVEHIVTLDLAAPTVNNGEMQLGLNYLPSSERLAIRVLKCTNVPLNRGTVQQDPLHHEYMIRVLLYHNGKLVKRKKTSPSSAVASLPGSSTASSSSSYSTKFANPVLDASLIFDVPVTDIDNVVFVVVLCLASTVVSSPETVVAQPTSGQDNSKDYLGKVILGTNARGGCRRHWEAMKNSPRREVVQWQALV